jgi:hypothetical protein
MRIGDVTFFAPEIPFGDVDLTGRTLPDQLKARMEGFYLQPADLCVDVRHAFAAGLLTVTCIDAMSRFAHGPNRATRGVRKDFCTYAQTRLRSFGIAGDARLLYEDFRNGLVHEARLKNGSQFLLDGERTLDRRGAFAVIDAALLLREARESVEGVVQEMRDSVPFQEELAHYVRYTFKHELVR